jgi:hypothetical protein
MCEFCLKHGEGQKWYLQANNYSEDLLNDIRRRKMIENFAADGESTAKAIEKMNKLPNAPKFIQALVKRLIPRKMKKRHYGQVVPIEDVEKIFGFVNSIARVACYCRHFTVGKEKRYCYGISMGPNGGKFGELMRNIDTSFLTGPDAAGVEMITKEQVIASFREHEKEGLCHTVWTFQTPFIGGNMQLRPNRLSGDAVYGNTRYSRNVLRRVYCLCRPRQMHRMPAVYAAVSVRRNLLQRIEQKSSHR